VLSERLGFQVAIQDLVAYIAGVVSHGGFTERFEDELTTPGIRVPLTTDVSLWTEAVDLGRQVVWASTYGVTFFDPSQGRPEGDIRYPANDRRRPLNLHPIQSHPLPDAIWHEGETLHVGGGTFAPVPENVWRYAVGGTQIIKKWFSSRKADPGGRQSSPLDQVHAQEWPYDWTKELNDLLTALRRLTELESRQRELLDSVSAGSLVTVNDLMSAGVFPVPAKARRPHQQITLHDNGTTV
jgi:hypothetical protein